MILSTVTLITKILILVMIIIGLLEIVQQSVLEIAPIQLDWVLRLCSGLFSPHPLGSDGGRGRRD